ncbi:MAG: hypothetical protein EOM24_12330 [Chloroflexia bacterium]|nr:hypothetical protein [Chloroflexia bacterium]
MKKRFRGIEVVMSEEQVRKIKFLLVHGFSLREIARLIQCSPGTVAEYRKKLRLVK